MNRESPSTLLFTRHTHHPILPREGAAHSSFHCNRGRKKSDKTERKHYLQIHETGIKSLKRARMH